MASDPKALNRLDAVTDELVDEILELQADAQEFMAKLFERAIEQRRRVNTVRQMAGLPEAIGTRRTG